MRNFSNALIIDDDEDLCMLLKSMLINDIQTVECSYTIESGKSMVSELNPDLILLDNNLPDGQGINLVPYIKSVSPNCCIILASAFTDLSKEAKEIGVDIFLEKPLSYNRVSEALNELLAQNNNA